jgi:hypothetical protein
MEENVLLHLALQSQCMWLQAVVNIKLIRLLTNKRFFNTRHISVTHISGTKDI